MEWRNPLESLDRLILNQFEKVAQSAYKRYGWDKYDLARVGEFVTGGGMVGAGMYLITAMRAAYPIVPYENSNLVYGFGSLTVIGGVAWYYWKRPGISEQQHQEMEMAANGEQYLPMANPIRPLVAGGVLSYLAYQTKTVLDALHLVSGLDSPEATALQFPLRLTATSLAMLFTAYVGRTCGSYILDTTPRPPQKKCYPLQSLVEKIKEKLNPKPAPEETAVPVRANYSTIDTIVNTPYQP